MPNIAEGNYLSDVLKYEAPNLFSREEMILASGQNLKIGAVVSRVTATGKLVELAPGASDGSEVALGVLTRDTDATAADTKTVIITRHAILSDKGVVWPSGITGPQQSTATAQLEARGILIRKGA